MIELTQTATLRVHVMLNGLFPDYAMFSGTPCEFDNELALVHGER